MTGYIDKSCL